MKELTPLETFKQEVTKRATSYKHNDTLQELKTDFTGEIIKNQYAYNFFWLGIPIIQAPQDLQALQEIIWETKPELIIETGIAWGGSLIFSASMLTLLESTKMIDKGHVLGIDIDIRPHNKQALLAHPLGEKITMFEGSSIDEKIINKVKDFAKNKRTMVCMDSNHTHHHVLSELKAYAPLVSKGCYCMVGDTGIEDFSSEQNPDRPWGKGNNPKTAVREFLEYMQNNKHSGSDGTELHFEIDHTMENKLLITACPDGYLKRV